MQKYKTVKTLGDGTFGTVYEAIHIKTGQLVAIKKMKQKYTSWNECIELRQIKSLRKLNHNNVMKLKEVLLVSDQLYMVFQFLDSNLYEMYSKMKQQGKCFTEAQIKSIIYQVVDGLAHTHKSGFFHRDLKPENILISNTNVVKLCDFGLAREIRSRPPFTDYVSTRWYRSPQLLLRTTAYNSPVDIFALGCILAELYTQTPLFPGNNQIDQLTKIVQVLGTPDKSEWPEGYQIAQTKSNNNNNLDYYFPSEEGVKLDQLIPQASPLAIDLIGQMLRYSSRKRPTASEQKKIKYRILKHQFFKDVELPDFASNMKETVFEQKPKGTKLNTEKQDKNLDIFRTTKEKFMQARKQEAHQNNPLKQHELRKSKLMMINKFELPPKNDEDDLDSLIKELEQKGKRKNQEEIQPREKFNTYSYNNRKENKFSFPITQPIKLQKDEWKFKSEQATFRNKESPLLQKQSQKSSRPGYQVNKFSYSFQPTLNPAYNIPAIHQTNLGYPALAKQKSMLTSPLYKF